MKMITYISESKVSAKNIKPELNRILANARQRNESFYVSIDEPIDQRRFANWSMECFHYSDPEDGFLELMHQIGEHFGKLSGFYPTSVYFYCWLTVAAMASSRTNVREERMFSECRF